MVRFCMCDAVENLIIEFAIHKVGLTNSIQVVLFQNPVLRVHNAYGGKIFLTGEL